MNPSTSITDDLLAQLRGMPLAQLAQQLGVSEQQTQSAVETAVPFLLGALGQNAAQPDGAQALFGALERDHASAPQAAAGMPDLSGLLGAVLGGAGGAGMAGALGGLLGGAGGAAAAPAPSGRFNAEGILGHILGGKKAQAESGLSQATGLDSAMVHKLLLMLAPLVMGYLGRQIASGRASSADALGSLLGRERSQVRQRGGAAGGLLGAVLDQNGDGKLDMGDVLQFGAQFLGGKRR
ncbi:DUF937 domain-containing protein [Vandammella animalimorsus]|uniref:DUF937 domain-containing protein n=1 Tax=Vandammella animalimorsus TaxID=2029117 RepID=A0A3M6RUB4_9BURK|nr:DUF937 domain-containing protein [Vandammella animalimorsus]RMX18960.1 DUF937 domain-containing protein [Vandammella animalimorsus]